MCKVNLRRRASNGSDKAKRPKTKCFKVLRKIQDGCWVLFIVYLILPRVHKFKRVAGIA